MKKQNSQPCSSPETREAETAKRPKDIRKIVITFIIFIAIFAAMFIFNTYTPLLSDDYSYAYSFRDFTRIEKAADIFPSMAAHRIYANGRVFSHFFVQLFMMLPKAVFNFVNAGIAAGIFALLLLFIKSEDKGANILCLLSGIFLTVCFTPDFGQVFLWLTGSCNYSWAMFFTLLYLYPYYFSLMRSDKFAGKGRFLFAVLFLPLSVLAGGYSESISIAVIFVAFCFTLYRYILLRKVDFLLAAGLVLSCCGYVFLMSAPVESASRGVFEISAVLYNAVYNLSSLSYAQIGLYCIFAFVFVLSLMSRVDKRAIVVSVILLLGGAGSVAAFSFAKYCPPRALVTITVYTVLAIMILLKELWTKLDKRVICACLAALGVFFTGELARGADDIIVNNAIAEKREEILLEAAESEDRTAILPQYISLTKYSAMWNGEEIAPYHGFWVNVAMARYYDLDYVMAEER